MKKDKIETIIRETAKEFNVDPMEIMKEGMGNRQVCLARSVCAVLLRDHLRIDQIGSLLGRRNYQYVNASLKKVVKKGSDDHDFFIKVSKLADDFSAKLPCFP